MFISRESFVMFAMKSYDNLHCKTIKEFETDLTGFTRLARLCSKDVSEELTTQTLNLVMTLMNVFVPDAAIKMMFYKVEPEYRNKLKTILVFLHRMPDKIPELNLIDSDIPICQQTAEELRKI